MFNQTARMGAYSIVRMRVKHTANPSRATHTSAIFTFKLSLPPACIQLQADILLGTELVALRLREFAPLRSLSG